VPAVQLGRSSDLFWEKIYFARNHTDLQGHFCLSPHMPKQAVAETSLNCSGDSDATAFASQSYVGHPLLLLQAGKR
jgi:hypothetical protein